MHQTEGMKEAELGGKIQKHGSCKKYLRNNLSNSGALHKLEQTRKLIAS